jgi:hypothetical protein
MVSVKNTTSSKILIQEGNAGVFAKRALLGQDQKYKLELDANATYREYVLITLPNNTPLEPVLSSDDISELKEILVIQQEDSDLPQMKLINKGDRAYHVVAPAAAPAPALALFQKLKHSVGRLLGRT